MSPTGLPWRSCATAARTWQRARALTDDPDQQAALLAWETVAWRLAGETAQAKTATDLLKEKYPQAQATLAGKQQDALQFVEQFVNIAAYRM